MLIGNLMIPHKENMSQPELDGKTHHTQKNSDIKHESGRNAGFQVSKDTALKVDLLFQGVRYSDALGKAASWALPNFYPYRFVPGEKDASADGSGQVSIPYLMYLANGSLVRVLGNSESPFWVDSPHAETSGAQFTLYHHDEVISQITFQPNPPWFAMKCSDGTPMSQVGISLHGDMAVVNLAPACQYHVLEPDAVREKEGEGETAWHRPADGISTLRCRFCAYGRPSARSAALGQDINSPHVPPVTLKRMVEALEAALAGGEIRHVYIVAGSMHDWNEEAARYRTIGVAIRKAGLKIPYLVCGSGALPREAMEQFAASGLYDAVCFNLEVWGKELFSKVCPGKNGFVGYDRWLQSLVEGVEIFGRGNVYTAMVTGYELEPQLGLDYDQALANSVTGARWMMEHGITPVYSLFWPFGVEKIPHRLRVLRQYFQELNQETMKIRKETGLSVRGAFMCERCAYMQLESDLEMDQG